MGHGGPLWLKKPPFIAPLSPPNRDARKGGALKGGKAVAPRKAPADERLGESGDVFCVLELASG